MEIGTSAFGIEHHAKFLLWAWDASAFGAAAFLAFRAHVRGEKTWGGLLIGFVCADLAVIFVANDIAAWPVEVHSQAEIAHHLIVWQTLRDSLRLPLPALLIHLFYLEEGRYLRRPTAWRSIVVAGYAVCGGFIANEIFSAVSTENVRPGTGYPGAAFTSIFTASCLVIAVWVGAHRGAARLSRIRKFYTWLVPLLVLAVLFQLGALVRQLPPAIGGLQACIPGCLIFALAYQLQPLTFDVLVKEVTFYFFMLFVVYVAVWSWFWALNSPGAPPGDLIVSVVRVTAHPDLLAALTACVWLILSTSPWVHRRWMRWLDRALLGRRYAAEGARVCFLAGLEGAITEDDLVRLSSRALENIFCVNVRVAMGEVQADANAGMSAIVRGGGRVCGVIEVAPRVRGLQFMGQDIDLLNSLAAQLSILLDNLRLRESTLAQERREQELQLLATRAELKALRAQINPHFLFNSLGAIAGLIRTDALRARETVEQLAEVFRYVLYRSQIEWVRLEEEIDFVTAYLSIERARFGARLQVETEIPDSARKRLVPAMMLQVLVENAVVHGVSSIRGPGIIRIRAECRGERLWLEVRDNGLGQHSPGSQSGSESRAGVGLRNVRDRLQLYYCGAGSLQIRREGSMTVACLDLPAHPAAGAAPALQ